MIDAHAHISFKKFNPDREEVIARCARLKLSVVDCAVTPTTLERSLELSSRYGFVYSTTGIHPYRAAKMDQSTANAMLESIERNIEELTGLGEAGLDYHLDRENTQRQREIFESIALIAKEYSLPLVVHAREAEEEALNLLLSLGVEKAMFHCYGGSVEVAQKILESGYSISLATNLCYSEHHQRLAEALPLESIMLETDSPYLSPIKQEKRNQPVFIFESVEKLAHLKGVGKEKVISAATANAR
ncbi:TatD family hydrolase, partial [Candidatus Pyrohabitans sp.]